jgi:hypothetical protein
MLKISHRGNLKGPSSRENHLWLGHDEPQYMTSKTFLDRYKDKLWIHCKDLSALEYFIDLRQDYKYFWHEEDSYALTSNGLIWTYPGKPVTDKSIIVLKGKETLPNSTVVFGICSDYVKII